MTPAGKQGWRSYVAASVTLVVLSLVAGFAFAGTGRESAPPNPSEGDIFVNSVDHHIYCHLGGVWKQLDN